MQEGRGALFTLHIGYEQLCRQWINASDSTLLPIIDSTLAVPGIKQLKVVKRAGAITNSSTQRIVGEQSGDGNKLQKGASDTRKVCEKR